jgi:hypothetical protein
MVDEDHKMLTWLCSLLAIADKSTLRKFVASFPRNQIAQLMMPHIESGKMALRGPLITLLRSGAVRTGAVGLDEDMRRRSLLVCLDGVCHVAGTLIAPNGVMPLEARNLAYDIRTNFANISLMRAMWSDGDAAIRVTSRSICALLARYLMRRGQLEGPELAWLQDVTGETPHAMLNSLGDFAVLDHMNLKSFVYGVLSPQAGELPTENTASFTKTLAILMDAGLQPPYDRTRFNAGLVNFIHRVENEDDPRGPFAANKLGQMYQSILQP